jgi:hypothetical protein
MNYRANIGNGRRLRSIAACTFLAAGILATTGCGGGGGGSSSATNAPPSVPPPTVPPSSVASIVVTPANALVVLGAPVQFTAMGTLVGGGTKDLTASATWSSSNASVATVNATGRVTAVAPGVLTITAVSGGTPGSTGVTVAVSRGLPSGIGWHALPSNTVLQASGACPPNNFGGDPFLFAESCGNVIRSWSGAIADATANANRLLIWGGGHRNYFGNEIYSLNLNEIPITLTRLKDPTIPTNFANRSNCVDGIPPGSSDVAPNSRENYGGLAFIPGAYQMYTVNGALACENADGTSNTWTISLTSLSNSSFWVHKDLTLSAGPKPGSNGAALYGSVASYDPNSRLVFVRDSLAIYTYNIQTNIYTPITPANGIVTSIYLSGTIDPIRKLFVLVGGLGCPGGTCGPGDGVFVADISNISNPTTTTLQNWTAKTMADPNCAEFLSGGVHPISSSNPGITFDSMANDFVGWPNQGDSIYTLTPDPANQRLTCQKLTFPGGPPNSEHAPTIGPNTSNGTFGRFQYFPGPDIFVLVNDWNIPAYVLRLR